MMRSIPRSHLSLPLYAEMMGLNPVHFQGAVARGIFQHVSGCDTVWTRHTWQNPDNVSHEDLAYQLVDAERSVTELLGYPPAPEWMQIDRQYPRGGNYYMQDVHGRFRTISTNIGEVIAGGVRGAEYLDTHIVTYNDDDGDGFKETASITLSTEPDWATFKLFHKGTNGEEEWEIRPIRKIDKLSLTIYVDSWLLIDPDLSSRFPTDDLLKFDITDGSNLVSEIDSYSIYNKDDVPTVTFIWGNGETTQDGFLEIVDREAGIVRPIPAIFDYQPECTILRPGLFCMDREPDRVQLSLYAGMESTRFKNGQTTDPLERKFAESVRLLATARLDRDLCGCNNVVTLGKDLRSDMALISPQGNFLAVADLIQECPFGTRRGEWLAWNRLRQETNKYVSVAVL